MKPRRGTAALFGALALLGSSAAVAEAQGLDAIGRELSAVEARATRLLDEPLNAEELRSDTYVEERLADGELHLRLQDFLRASIIFTDIVDHHAGHPAFADALFLLGESLFQAGDYLGARTRYRSVIDSAGEASFRPYVQRSLGRLIEIAIHTRSFEGVEAYFEQLDRLPPSELEAVAAYFRAKYLYNRAIGMAEIPGVRDPERPADPAELALALAGFEAVNADSPYHARARYFVGVIETLLGDLPVAADAFGGVVSSEAADPEGRELIVLANLALGRIYYETDELERSAGAYQRVPRTSPLFERALYEIAWVYIRMGDPVRAERALEVLSVAAPDSPLILEGKILRGNLLIRNERFDDANRVFREIRAEFGPVLVELDAIRDQHSNLSRYFRSLVRANLEAFDVDAFLPESARRWVRVEGDFRRAIDAVESLAQSRRLMAETADLVARLDAALSSANVVNVFGDLRAQRETITVIRNGLAGLRRQLIAREEDRGTGSTELNAIRSARRDIERRIGGLPTSDDDFMVRHDEALGRFRAMTRQLSEMKVELRGIEARVVAIDTFLSTTSENIGDRVAAEVEVGRMRAAAEAYVVAITELERAIEIGRLQVGVGDEVDQQDTELRDRYRSLIRRERELLGGPANSQIDRYFGRIFAVEARLDQREAEIEPVVLRRVAEMRGILEEESANLERYRGSVSSLEGESGEVVGAVTHANYERVRDRFYQLVIRSEVGHVDVAWARRETHRRRADELSRERVGEIGALDEEFHEVMDARDEAEGP